MVWKLFGVSKFLFGCTKYISLDSLSQICIKQRRSVPFFPTLNSEELQSLLHFGDVSALFMGKVNAWDEIKKGIPEDMLSLGNFGSTVWCSNVLLVFSVWVGSS